MKRYARFGSSSDFAMSSYNLANLFSCSSIHVRELIEFLDHERQVSLDEDFRDHKFLDELQASIYEVVANLMKKLTVGRSNTNSKRKKTLCGGAANCQEEELVHVHLSNRLQSHCCGILCVFSLM